MSFVNINGVWKQLDKIFVNINGVWKEVEKAFVNVGGVWKEVEGLKQYFMYRIPQSADKVNEVNFDTRTIISTVITKPGSLVGNYSSIGGGKDYFYLSVNDYNANRKPLLVYNAKPNVSLVKGLTADDYGWSTALIKAVGYDNSYIYSNKIVSQDEEWHNYFASKINIQTGAVVIQHEFAKSHTFIATNTKIFSYFSSTKTLNLVNTNTLASIESVNITLSTALEGYDENMIVESNLSTDKEYVYPSMALIKTISWTGNVISTAIVKP